MNKNVTNLVLSILIIIIPILGFPGSWKSFFIIILGLFIALISFRMYREEISRLPKPKSEGKSTAYIDNLNETSK